MPIPRLLWQTYKTHTVPQKWKTSPISLMQHHPAWEYNLTDDEENRMFVKENYPEHLLLYDRLWKELKPIASVDMVRYLLLHKHGGVYLDLDYRAVKPFDSLFASNASLYLVRTPNLGGYTNSFMASAPGCDFWMQCIAEIKKRIDNAPWYIRGDVRILWTTGPGMITSVANEYTQPFMTLPYKLAHPCSICDHYNGTICTSEESYVEEFEGSS